MSKDSREKPGDRWWLSETKEGELLKEEGTGQWGKMQGGKIEWGLGVAIGFSMRR